MAHVLYAKDVLLKHGYKIANITRGDEQTDSELFLKSGRVLQFHNDGTVSLLGDTEGGELFHNLKDMLAILELRECECEDSSDRGPYCCDIHKED